MAEASAMGQEGTIFSIIHTSYCPPGMEALLSLGEVVVHPQMKKYKITNSQGEKLFKCKQQMKGNCCLCCCDHEACYWQITLRDLNGQDLVYLDRYNQQCTGCCHPTQSMKVRMSSDAPLGEIKVDGYSKLTVSNPSDDFLYEVTTDSRFTKTHWKIAATDGTHIGSIDRLGRSKLKMKVTFPTDLDIRHKILLLCLAVGMQTNHSNYNHNQGHGAY